MRKVLIFVKRLLAEASLAPDSEYNNGYTDALTEVADEIEAMMWEEGDYIE